MRKIEEAQKRLLVGEALVPWVIEQQWSGGYTLAEGKILREISKKILDTRNRESEIVCEILSPEQRNQFFEKLHKHEIGKHSQKILINFH
jgi:hypothetical protein